MTEPDQSADTVAMRYEVRELGPDADLRYYVFDTQDSWPMCYCESIEDARLIARLLNEHSDGDRRV